MIELLKFYRLRFVSQLVRLHPAFLRDAKHILRLQQQRFRKLIKHAGRASPHYERKFAGINLETCGLTDLPILTKHEMMENFEDLVTDRTLRRRTFRNCRGPVQSWQTFAGVCRRPHLWQQPACPDRGKMAMRSFNLCVQVRLRHANALFPARLAIVTQRQASIQAASFSATCRRSSSLSSGSNGFRCLTTLSKRSRYSTNSSPI